MSIATRYWLIAISNSPNRTVGDDYMRKHGITICSAKLECVSKASVLRNYQDEK